MVWKKIDSPKKYLRGQIVLSLVLVVVLALIALVIWIVTNSQVAIQPTVEIPDAQPELLVEQPEEQVAEAPFDTKGLQTVVDQWASSVDGTSGVVITDVDGKVLASHNPDESFFAASIYKLFVAYEGYRQLDTGKVNSQVLYVNSSTRAECLDLMIRESDSPCAEKLWIELGKQNLTNTLNSYGITNTSMTNITTTAADVAKILTRIANSEGLSGSSQKSLLKSMRTQVYRDALNKGFSTNNVVYNKIGFRELVEYHDTAIVSLEDGRQLIVSVLTENVGTKNIAELGELIEEVIAD